MNRIFFFVLICLATTVTAQQVIPFGNGNKITYNLQTGNYSVWESGKEVIKDATALYDDPVPPVKRTWKAEPVQDAFGKGMKYTISAGKDHQHIFYTYNNLNGFYTMTIHGGGARRTSPLSGTLLLQRTGLVVPFDNDAWIRYNTAKDNFVSAEVTALYDSLSAHGMIIGSVEHNDWKTGISVQGGQISAIAGWTDSTITRDVVRHGLVESGRSPRILVLFDKDWRMGLEKFAAANRVAEPRYVKDWKGAKPFGWNSWGSMQTKLSLSKAKSVVDFFADSIPDFRSDGTAYIDLDSYWDMLSFQQLTEFVTYCKSKHLKAGIYWAPFVDWGKSPRRMEGSEYNYQDVWTKTNGRYHDFDGTRALDPTHPATKARIASLIKKFKECGFEMIKIDFIGHAAIEADHFYDPTVKTGMQAFRKGMEFLSDQLQQGSPMLVYAAISPNFATNRYVHMRRIACDAFKSINETDYTLNSTSMGWWQHYMYDHTDADHVVFAEETPAANRARLVSSIVTGSVILGDDFSVPTNAQAMAKQFFGNKELVEAMRHSGKFQPVNAEKGYRFKTDHYIAIINCSKEPGKYFIGRKVKDLFTGTTTSLENIIVPPGDAVFYRIFQ